MVINEAQKYPEDKPKFDFNYLTIFGYCNQNLCSKRQYCYRYQEKAGKNNVNWIPKQDDYSTCKFFKPANCYFCNRKGYFEDEDAKGGIIRTACIVCDGKGKLFPKGE